MCLLQHQVLLIYSGHQHDINILILCSSAICVHLDPASSYVKDQPSRARPVHAKAFHHPSVVPGLSGVRVTIRRLLLCALENLGFSGILDAVQQSKSLKEMFT